MIGAAVALRSAGLAACASRRQVAAPGLLAPTIVLVVIAPVMMSGAFTWGSLYPVEYFPDSVLTLWLTVLGAAACFAGLRPGLRS